MQCEKIYSLIYEVRGEKVMLDKDLAILFDVETRALKQAVKRNIRRFPKDFCFELREKEIAEMVSQNVIPSKSYFRGASPFVFTEHGVTMLANVLKSDRAIEMSLAIVRAFIAMRKFALSYKSITAENEDLKNTVGKHDKKLNHLFQALELLLQDKQNEKHWDNRNVLVLKSNRNK